MGEVVSENPDLAVPLKISEGWRRSNLGLLAVRLVAVLLVSPVAFLLTALSFAHNCDAGVQWIERGSPFVGRRSLHSQSYASVVSGSAWPSWLGS